MENGGSEGRLRTILRVVKEEWYHDLILPHEDSPFTSDGVIFNEEIDDDVIGDGAFRDESTGRQRKAKGDAEHNTAVIL